MRFVAQTIALLAIVCTACLERADSHILHSANNHLSRAHAALLKGAFDDAARMVEKHLAVTPPEAILGRRQHQEINPHHILGHCRYQAGNLTGAIREFMLAAKQQPDSAIEWLNLADVLKFSKFMREAQAAMGRVVHHLGQTQFIGRLAGLQLWTGDWQNYTEHRALAGERMIQEHRLFLAALVVKPQPGLLMHTSSNERLLVTSNTSATDLHDIPPRLMPWTSFGPVLRALTVNPPELVRWPAGCGFDMHCKARPQLPMDHDRRLKVGLLSPDWAEHPVIELAHGMLERLAGRRGVELVLLPQSQHMGDLTKGLAQAASAIVHVNKSSVQANRELLRSLHLDIVVDMAGHTVGGGFGLLAGRVAPLQVAYLGYPATTAAPWIDFIISDPIALPADTLQLGSHTERAAYMKGSYIPSSHAELHRAIATMTAQEWYAQRKSVLASVRSSCSDDDVVLLGVLSSRHKIDPSTMSMWLDILKADPCTVMVLISTGVHDEIESHLMLREWSKQQGVDPARLQWLPRLSRDLHLKVKSVLDIVLDSPLKSGHSSHVDAMWIGVPVVTMQGQHMHNKAPQSLCQGEMEGCAIVTNSKGEYVASVLDLLEKDQHGERYKLRQLQEQLKERVLASAMGTIEPSVWSTGSQAARFGQVLHAMHELCSWAFNSDFATNATNVQPANAGRLEGLLAWGDNWSGCKHVGHVFAGSRMLWRSVLARTQQLRSEKKS